MATRSLGALTLDLILKLGGFEKGMDQAARISEKRMRQIEATAKKIGAGIGLAFTAAAGGFVAFIKTQTDAIASYQDIAEKIGDTAEAVASLKPAADVSGTALEEVAAASIKLSAALSKTDDESKGVGKALAAIGISIEDFKKLSPVEQIDAIAQGLAKFEDGAGKTAVAVTLLGKSGAQLLPFLNDLADGAERQTILTQAQIDAANELQETFAALKGQAGTLAQTLAADIIPVVLEVVKAFAALISEVKTVGGDNSIREFSQSASLGFVNVIEFINRTIQTLNALRGSFQVVFNDIRVFSKAASLLNPVSAVTGGGLSGQVGSLKALLDQREKTQKEADARYQELFNTNFTKVSDSLRNTFDEQKNYVEKTNALPKPKLNFSGVVDKEADKAAKAVKKNADAIQAVIDRLKEQNATFGQTAAQSDIYTLSQLRASESQIALAQSLANSIDAKEKSAEVEKYLVGLREEAALVEATTEKTNAYKLAVLGASQAQIDEANQLSRSIDEQKKFNDLKQEATSIIEASRTPLQEYQDQVKKLNEFLRLGIIDQTQYNQAIAAAQDAFDKARLAADPWAKELQSITDEAARNIQSAFADFLFDPFEKGLSGMLKSFADTLQRMAAEAAAAQIFKSLAGSGAGSFFGGGGGGSAAGIGGIGDYFKAIFGGFFASGGPVSPGKAYVVGEEGPEWFMPKSAGTIVPNGAGMTVNQSFVINAPQGSISKATQLQLAAQAAKGAARGSVRNN